MTPFVEICAGTDPPYLVERSVRYCVRFDGRRSQATQDYSVALAWAEALMAEHDAGGLIDRSDKGSGFLLSTLRH